MVSALMRLARILVAQAISWALLEWGGVNVPMINVSVGALVNTIFKILRDKFPGVIEWLPL